MNPVTSTIHATPALDHNLEPGLHLANIVRAAMQLSLNSYGKPYTSLKLEFTSSNGRASLRIPDFTHLIPSVFRALGSQADPNDPNPDEILALRHLEAEVHVVHQRSKGKTYANVTSINGVLVTK